MRLCVQLLTGSVGQFLLKQQPTVKIPIWEVAGSVWVRLYFYEWLTGNFALPPGHHLCHQHHYFPSEKQTRVTVSHKVVSTAAQFAIHMRSGHTQFSQNETPTHTSPSHSLHSCFPPSWFVLSLYLAFRMSLLGDSVTEHFPIPI